MKLVSRKREGIEETRSLLIQRIQESNDVECLRALTAFIKNMPDTKKLHFMFSIIQQTLTQLSDLDIEILLLKYYYDIDAKLLNSLGFKRNKVTHVENRYWKTLNNICHAQNIKLDELVTLSTNRHSKSDIYFAFFLRCIAYALDHEVPNDKLAYSKLQVFKSKLLKKWSNF